MDVNMNFNLSKMEEKNKARELSQDTVMMF